MLNEAAPISFQLLINLFVYKNFQTLYTREPNYHPVASRLLERPFLRWLFGAADPTKLAQCCRDRSFRPTYTVSFNGLCKRRPRVLGRYGGPRFYGIKFMKNVIQTGPPGRTNPFTARGLRLHNVSNWRIIHFQ